MSQKLRKSDKYTASTQRALFALRRIIIATLANFGIPGGGSGHLHPKQKNKWRVTFANIGKLVAGHNSRDLTVQATTVTRPQLEFEEVQIHRYNSTSYIAGKHTWSPMNMTVEDDIGGLAAKVIKAQLETTQRLVGVDLDGRWLNTAAAGSDYKFGMKLEMLDGDEGVLETWILEGVWIQSMDGGDMDYSASEAATVQLVLRFDHARSIDSGDGVKDKRATGGEMS